ncbi:hypothetical protein L1049_004777 [Liquidambar formosana]|uniref:RING-type domain-containing protein n=1 Tax=Liquidambar formosana TaxID=63359 RepID=A0AAP0RTZ4_LIQFO
MGQSLQSMGQQQSRDQLLHELVISGNVEAIRALCSEGVDLERINQEGKTPLIVACMNPELYTVAKTLIELGANINVYRPGRHAGTPLHHAAKRGLDQTVKVLLAHGANAFVRNDDCQTPLDVARAKSYNNVVRTIENHICYFSGWLREIYGPGFLGALASQLLSRKIWVVVIPCGSNNPMKPLKLELVIYNTSQDSQPRTVIALWKAKIEEPKSNQSDPALIIFDNSTKTRYKLASASEGDGLQIQWLYNACIGIPQGMPPSVIHDVQTSVAATATQNAEEAAELAMAIGASVQSPTGDRPPLLPNAHQTSEASNTNGRGNSVDNISHNGWGPAGRLTQSEASSSGWIDERVNEEYNGWGVPESGAIANPTQHTQTQDKIPPIIPTTNEISASISSVPSAPPIPEEDLYEGPIHYPSIDISPVDLSVPAIEDGPSRENDGDNGGGSSSCVICWEAPVEGACIPCGHMAGCMSCLNKIKTKKGDCPVCRAKIDQVIKLYAV